MMRYSVLVALVGCTSDVGGSTDERIPISSGPFTPLLCTGGTPGDPTCPVTHVVFPIESELRVSFVMTPISDSAQLSSLVVSGSPLHLENLRIEQQGYMALLAGAVEVGITDLNTRTVVLGWSIQPTHTLELSAEVVR